MASKKGKKSKGTTISFQEFTARVEGETAPNAGQNVVYAPKKPVLSSWADEVEEDELITAKERIVLPSAPRASRGPAYDDSEIPRSPPFQINLGNLNYDIDDDDIYKFFRDLDIQELKLPRDHQTNRIKGFGFVIFETRKDLIDALIRNEQMLRGRPVRISLGQDRVRGEGGPGGREGRGRPPAEDEGVDNWRSVMSETARPDFRQGGDAQGYGGHQRSERRYDDRQQMRRSPSADSSEGAATWRGAPQSTRRPPSPTVEFTRDDMRRPDSFQPRDRRDDYNRDYRQPRDDYRQPRDEYRQPRDDYNTRRGPPQRSASPEFVRPEVTPRAVIEQPHPEPQPEQKQRKKLVLQPRSADTVAPVAASAPNYDSIFGGAKPVDTTKREMEIEEKIEKLKVIEPIVIVEQKPLRIIRKELPRKILTSAAAASAAAAAARNNTDGVVIWRHDSINNAFYSPSPFFGDGSVEAAPNSRRGRVNEESALDERDSHSEPEDDRDFKLSQRGDSKRDYPARRGGGPREDYNRRPQPQRDMRGGAGSNYRRPDYNPQQQQRGPPRMIQTAGYRGDSRGRYPRQDRNDARGPPSTTRFDRERDHTHPQDREEAPFEPAPAQNKFAAFLNEVDD